MSYVKHKSEESMEDYLETILVLSKRLPVVRSIDIANELNYSKPSVSVAMKNLKGRVAESVYERHSVLSDWLIRLGVDREIAIADACKMEHDISPESFEAMKKWIAEMLP